MDWLVGCLLLGFEQSKSYVEHSDQSTFVMDFPVIKLSTESQDEHEKRFGGKREHSSCLCAARETAATSMGVHDELERRPSNTRRSALEH